MLITNPPFRLKILRNLTTLLHTVVPDDGATDQFDLSGDDCVVRGRLFIGDDEEVPMVAINEPPSVIEQMKASPQNPSSAGDWDILLQGWADDDKRQPCDGAYVLAAQVRRALALEKVKPSGRPGSGQGPNFLGLGPVITDMRVGAPVVRPPDETSRLACFYMILTLQIVEDMTKPFG